MMPASNSEQHAMLIREMSRDLNRSRGKNAQSSNGDASSTTSSFDPENEAAMSTRQIDNFSQRLPDIRPSPKHYPRHQSLDYAINTSALGRAFPEFSQSISLEEEESLSIEMGRGGKARDMRDYSLSIQGGGFNALNTTGNHQINSSPPRAPQEKVEKRAGGLPGISRRDTQVRRVSAAQSHQGHTGKRTEHLSGKHQPEKQRQSLGELHARVAQDYDESQISDERPPTLNLTKTSTRFGHVQVIGNGLPSKFTSSKDLARALDHETSAQGSKRRPKQSRVSSTMEMENSFMLPDLPNLSELVSGVFQDGSPVFSRNAKSKPSRFTSATRNSRDYPSHAAVSSIPIPEDEQAIFVSLKLLQDKVADLEQQKAEAEATVQELEVKNRSLEQEKSEQSRFRRSDSALGSTDGSDGGDVHNGSRKLIIEKSRLESTVRALQEQVSKVAKKSSVADITIRNLTQERDAAISQLGVAYFTTEQLKIENQALGQEIEELKAELAPTTARGKEGLSARQHRGQPSTADSTRDRAVQAKEDPMETAAAAQKTRLPSNAASNAQEKRKGKVMPLQAVAPTQNDTRRSRHRLDLENDSGGEGNYVADPKTRGAKNDIAQARNRRKDEMTGEITYLSFTNNNDIAELRRTLEMERIARKNGTATIKGADEATHTRSERDAPIPRKSSMKNQGGKPSRSNGAERLGDNTAHSRASKVSVAGRCYAEESILEHEIRCGHVRADDLTSAFIIPDITIRNLEAQPPLKLSASVQRVFDGLARHDGKNCTVCKQYIIHGSDHTHETHDAISIPKPVPVSERMPEPDTYEEEPTQRPAQAPGLALATVLKGLEDELAHLKIMASQYQALYNKQDPSLSKRKRKSVLLKIETTLKAVDVKADQIYALYDVLEGQKANGLDISEEQVEVTLQSIGIDLTLIGLRGGGGFAHEDQGTTRGSQLGSSMWEVSSSNDDEDLPWEGIESTADLTTPSIFANRRSSWGI